MCNNFCHYIQNICKYISNYICAQINMVKMSPVRICSGPSGAHRGRWAMRGTRGKARVAKRGRASHTTRQEPVAARGCGARPDRSGLCPRGCGATSESPAFAAPTAGAHWRGGRGGSRFPRTAQSGRDRPGERGIALAPRRGDRRRIRHGSNPSGFTVPHPPDRYFSPLSCSVRASLFTKPDQIKSMACRIFTREQRRAAGWTAPRPHLAHGPCWPFRPSSSRSNPCRPKKSRWPWIMLAVPRAVRSASK